MYKAQRDITLNGVAYKQGDPVPFNAAPERVMKNLVGRGWIKPAAEGGESRAPVEQEEIVKFPIAISGPDGNRLTQELSAGEVQQVFDLLMTSVRELEPAVSSINDLNLLAVVDAVDPRKTAKELYAVQAKKILDGAQTEGVIPSDENSKREGTSITPGGDA